MIRVWLDYAFGGVLIQGSCPVTLRSRNRSDIERWYKIYGVWPSKLLAQFVKTVICLNLNNKLEAIKSRNHQSHSLLQDLLWGTFVAFRLLYHKSLFVAYNVLWLGAKITLLEAHLDGELHISWLHIVVNIWDKKQGVEELDLGGLIFMISKIWNDC